MNRRILLVPLALAVTLAGVLSVTAQETKTKAPICRYGMSLKFRKAGEDDFKKDQKITLECFQEDETGNAIFISQSGALASVGKGLFKGGDGKDKGPLAQHGLEIVVRKVDGKTVPFGVECFVDENNGNLIYVSQTASLGVIPSKFAATTKGKPKGYTRTHGMNMKVRKAGNKDFDDKTPKYGVDVFDDENNQSVIYMSETGALTAVPRAQVAKDATAGKAPEWQYGLELKVRNSTEKDFGKDTKAYGVEVFKDANNGCMVYIVENGNIAVVPASVAKFGATDAKSKDPESKRGFTLGVRKLDENTFSDSTKKFGVEAYVDENNGNVIYLSETGNIAVAPQKEE